MDKEKKIKKDAVIKVPSIKIEIKTK